MALTGKQLEELMKPISKTGSEIKLPSIASQEDTKLSTINSLTKQKENIGARLSAVGEDAKKLTDTRNPLEKLFNLTPDQSFIFDIFELLNRPQQALFGAIEAGAQGGNALEGALTGLSGENKTGFKDVLKSVTKSELGDVQGQLDFVDVVGLAGDVLLDPVDLGLMMVTGGTSLAGQIAGQATDAITDTARLIGTTDEAYSAAQVAAYAKKTKIAEDTTKALGGLQDVLFGKGKRIAKLSPEDYVKAIVSKRARADMGLEAASITSMSMKSMAGAFKGMSQLTDASLSYGFKSLGNENLSKAYDGLKQGFAEAASQKGQKLKRAMALSMEKYQTTKLRFMGIDKKMMSEFSDLAKLQKDRIQALIDSGKTIEEAQNIAFGEYSTKVFDAFEHIYSSNLVTPEQLIDMLRRNVDLPFSEATLNDMNKIFGEDAFLGKFERATYGNSDAIRFNKDVFQDEVFLQDLLSRARSNRDNIFSYKYDKLTLTSYERSLRENNINDYNQYLVRIEEYEKELEKRALARFVKENGYSYVDGDANNKLLQKIKNAIEVEDIKIDTNLYPDLVKGEDKFNRMYRHPQTYLEKSVYSKDRFSLWLTEDERKKAFTMLSPEDQATYSKQIEDGRAIVEAKNLTKKAAEEELDRLYASKDRFLRDRVQQVDVEDVAFSQTLAGFKRRGRIEIGKWSDDLTQKYLDDISNDELVRRGVDTYKQALQEAQRAIGLTEFSDPDALFKMSFEGYTKHAINQNVTDFMKAVREKNKDIADRLDFAFFLPGNIAKTGGRKYYGSAIEVNKFTKDFYTEMFNNDDWVKKTFEGLGTEEVNKFKQFIDDGLFTRSASASMFSFMEDSYGAIHSNSKITDMLLSMSIGNPSKEGSAFQIVTNVQNIPYGYEKLTTGDFGQVQRLISILEANQKFAGKSSYVDDLLSQLKNANNPRTSAIPVLERHIYDLLWGTQVSPKKALGILDLINNGFKIGKTTSIGFNIKNLTGNMLNQWLAGVPISQMPSYWNKSVKMSAEMKAIDKIIIEQGIEALSEAQMETYKIYKEFLDAGFMSKASVYSLQNIDMVDRWAAKEDIKTWSTLMDNPVTRFNMDVNLEVDRYARLSLYLYAKDNPAFLAKLGIDTATDDAAMKAVRLVHFDPNDLTFFEDDVMKRLVPFYTFTRQNMAFQLKNLTRNSEKYRKLFKAYDAYNQNIMELAPEDLQDYQRNQLYLPVWKKENGEYVVVKSSLPITALTELELSPVNMTQNIVSKLTPAIRLPFELSTGVQTYTGQPIERYKGELSTRIPIPGMTKSMEWLLGQVGLDTPLSTVSQLGMGAYQAATGQDGLKSTLKATGIGDVINPQDTRLSKLYNEIESLNARVNVLKSKNIEIPTLEEINMNQQDTKTKLQQADLQRINELINNIKR